MCVPVDTARRTVRSGRSPYTSRLEATRLPQLGEPVDDGQGRVAGDHRAVEGADGRAEHQVGRDALLEQRLQHAHLGRAQHPTAAEHERGGHGVRHVRQALGELGVLGAHPLDHAALDPEDDQRDQTRGQVEDGERDAPAGSPRQQERHHDVDHEHPAVHDPQHARALAELLEVAALGGEVLQRQRDQGAEGQQHADDEGEHAVADEEAAHVQRPYRLVASGAAASGGRGRLRPPRVPTATTRTPRTSRRTTTPRRTAGCGTP